MLLLKGLWDFWSQDIQNLLSWVQVLWLFIKVEQINKHLWFYLLPILWIWECLQERVSIFHLQTNEKGIGYRKIKQRTLKYSAVFKSFLFEYRFTIPRERENETVKYSYLVWRCTQPAVLSSSWDHSFEWFWSSWVLECPPWFSSYEKSMRE